MVFYPRAGEAQSVSEVRKDSIEEGAVLVRALHDQG